jgi:nucleoside phosphorylase
VTSTVGGRLLIVGALGAETLPILRALSRPRPLSARLVAGFIADRPVAVLTCGVGPDKAARRVAAALPLWDAQQVVSIGTCGGLVDSLSVGSVVTATRLFHEDAPCPAPLPWPGIEPATIITVRRGVFTASRRADLAARGGTVCEMEAAAVQSVVGLRPFTTLKVVSDLAGGASDDPPTRPGPMDFARFKAVALRLSAEHLLPVLSLRQARDHRG